MKDFAQWEGFEGSRWKEQINVRDFIRHNYTPYDGDDSFLEGPTEATDKLWGKLQELQKAERANNGVLDMETKVVTGLTAYGPGYISEDLKDLEKVVGLQTDKPLKRAFMPYGGIKMAEQACEMYGYKVDPQIHDMFTKYEFKTHNQGVFDIYTPEMKRARHSHILTGLPDTYGRGRIVGDYRRVALYGIDALIAGKEKDFADSDRQGMRRYDFQLREEIADQIRALKGMKEMAKVYGYDISEPAKNAHEAFQWLYFGYLAAIKTQNGAAMSVGRISTFLDIYIERDLKNGVITEKEAQELVDHMVMKFRMVKFARIESYNQLFSGDPVWATLEVAGMGQDGRSMVTKNDFRFLHTLENMGPAPEPNLTVLYSSRLPENFKKYTADISVLTSSVQYENDDVMRPLYALTTVCPVYISSICPLISPRCFCCLLKYFCDLPIIIIIMANPNKDDSIAVTVIRTLVLNIINTEPKSKVTDDISIPTLILRDCPIISTSLVTLERISPVDVVL